MKKKNTLSHLRTITIRFQFWELRNNSKESNTKSNTEIQHINLSVQDAE